MHCQNKRQESNREEEKNISSKRRRMDSGSDSGTTSADSSSSNFTSNSTSKSSNDFEKSLKERLKNDIQRYFIQITKGCGISNCEHPLCASNPAFGPMHVENAVLRSFQLALEGNSLNLCPNVRLSTLNDSKNSLVPTAHSPSVLKRSSEPPKDYKEPEFMDYEQFSIMVEEAQSTNQYTPIVRKIGLVFSQSECLNASFLKRKQSSDIDNNNNNMMQTSQEESLLSDVSLEVNIEDVRHFYGKVLLLPAVVNSLSFACERLSTSLRITAPLCNSPIFLRQFLILLENPLLSEESNHKPLLFPLCASITLLPKQYQEILISYLEKIGTERFSSLLDILQEALSLRSVSNNLSVNRDDVIIAITKVLHLFYQANSKSNFVSYTRFYNDLLNEKIDPREDFANWKKENRFSFCNYPFVLDPAVKSRILHIDSLIQMYHLRAEAFHLLSSGTLVEMTLSIRVRRDNLIEDSLFELNQPLPEDLKKELKVSFVGEEAIDEGGVKKEWFQLIIREIFNEKYGMFVLNEKTRTYWFNGNSTDFSEFRLIGMLLGLAIYNGVILDLHFPPILYKRLLGGEPKLDDVGDIDPAMMLGLKRLLEFTGDVQEVYEQSFQLCYEYFGERRTYDLKPNGANILLNNENRKEYADLYVKYLLVDSIQKQFDAFLNGFKLLCDTPAFRLFRSEELELLICGSPVLDFEALEKSTIYDNGYSKDDTVIRNFWEVVHSFTLEQKRRLLFFATGSDRAPIRGLGHMTFVISRHGNDNDKLPSAHTCFNHLLLPAYTTKENLRERLLTAINNAEGFGMI